MCIIFTVRMTSKTSIISVDVPARMRVSAVLLSALSLSLYSSQFIMSSASMAPMASIIYIVVSARLRVSARQRSTLSFSLQPSLFI